MKKLILIILTTFLLNISNVFAQNTSLNIAVINADDVLSNSKVVNFIQEKIINKEKEYQVEINKKQTSLKKEFQEIEKKRSVLSEKSLKKEEDKFAKKYQDLKEELTKRRESLKTASLKAFVRVDKKMNKIIKDISEEQDIDLVLPTSNIIFAKDKLDISAQVLERLNEQMTKVKVRFN